MRRAGTAKEKAVRSARCRLSEKERAEMERRYGCRKLHAQWLDISSVSVKTRCSRLEMNGKREEERRARKARRGLLKRYHGISIFCYR